MTTEEFGTRLQKVGEDVFRGWACNEFGFPAEAAPASNCLLEGVIPVHLTWDIGSYVCTLRLSAACAWFLLGTVSGHGQSDPSGPKPPSDVLEAGLVQFLHCNVYMTQLEPPVLANRVLFWHFLTETCR